jgi:hypothetical protein
MSSDNDYSAVKSSSRLAPSKVENDLKELKEKEWLSPMYVVLVSLIVVLIIMMIVYFSLGDIFTGSGPLANAGWVSSGGGFLFLAIAGLFVISASSAFGLVWKGAGLAVGMTLIASLLFGILFYFILGSVRDAKKDLFLIWSAVTVIGGILIAVYGWWGTRDLAMKADKFMVEELKSRAMWALVLMVIAVVSVFILLAAFWSIYGQL